MTLFPPSRSRRVLPDRDMGFCAELVVGHDDDVSCPLEPDRPWNPFVVDLLETMFKPICPVHQVRTLGS